MKEKTESFIKVMEDFIKDNPHWDDVVIAWYEIKKIVGKKLKENEQVKQRMKRYRLRQEWTLCI